MLRKKAITTTTTPTFMSIGKIDIHNHVLEFFSLKKRDIQKNPLQACDFRPQKVSWELETLLFVGIVL